MDQLNIIRQEEVLGKQFRIYGTYENPLFLAKDVAEWIEYSETNVSKLVSIVDDNEKVRNIVTTLGGNQESWFLTEDGLYEVLMQSRKPIAKQFKKEIKVILQSIRKHGAYMTAERIEEVLSNPDTIIRLATDLKAEREKRSLLELENKKKDQMIGELKPKADYTDKILQSKALVTITQIAKDYGMSGNGMNRKLHEMKIQYKQNDQWLLYVEHQTKGYTHSQTICFKHEDGRPDTKIVTKWTQKGRLFLYEKLKGNGILPVIEQDNFVA